MAKKIFPFKSIETQRNLAIVILMLSIFLIFYTPTIFSFDIVGIIFTSSILGVIIFLISAYYLLNSFD